MFKVGNLQPLNVLHRILATYGSKCQLRQSLLSIEKRRLGNDVIYNLLRYSTTHSIKIDTSNLWRYFWDEWMNNMFKVNLKNAYSNQNRQMGSDNKKTL